MATSESASRRPGFSVRARILAATLAIAAVGMTVAGVVAYLYQRDRHLADVDDRLVANVDAARAVLTAGGASEPDSALVARAPDAQYASTREAVESVLARVLPTPYQSSLGIIDGAPAYVPAADVAFQLQDDAALVERVNTETADGSVRLGTVDSPLGTLRYIAAPVTVANDPVQGVYLTAFDLDRELAELRAAFLTYAVVASIALVGIGVAGWFVAGRLLAPIRRLTETASRITATDLTERIPVTGRDDVSQLTVTVNGMLDRLDGAMSTQRQLLDDVRHELNTPLTIVRGHLEIMDPRDADDVGAVRTLALDELDRMAGLVSDIAALSASEQRSLRLEPTDIGDLTRDVFAKASAIGGHEWRLAESVDVVADLDGARITQAWLQLCDNAAKYSPDGALIEVGTAVTRAGVEFWVADRGPGIPADSIERIFERFGRIDTGRGVQGSGLGLPIVRIIARAHGGDVSLRTSSAGSRFGIVVPVNDVPGADRTAATDGRDAGRQEAS